MSDRDALLAAILENPGCDTVRLAFADWLEENGEEMRGELIRQHIAKPLKHQSAPGVPARWEWFASAEVVELAPALPGVSWGVSRGFVSEIHLPCAAFMQHAEGIFRAHPVTKVVLTDVRPTMSEFEGRGDPWTFAGLGLSERLYSISGWRWWHPTAEATDAYLSARCVAYGRALAGLPPLA